MCRLRPFLTALSIAIVVALLGVTSAVVFQPKFVEWAVAYAGYELNLVEEEPAIEVRLPLQKHCVPRAFPVTLQRVAQKHAAVFWIPELIRISFFWSRIQEKEAVVPVFSLKKRHVYFSLILQVPAVEDEDTPLSVEEESDLNLASQHLFDGLLGKHSILGDFFSALRGDDSNIVEMRSHPTSGNLVQRDSLKKKEALPPKTEPIENGSRIVSPPMESKSDDEGYGRLVSSSSFIMSDGGDSVRTKETKIYRDDATNTRTKVSTVNDQGDGFSSEKVVDYVVV